MKFFKILSELSFGGSMGGDIYFFDKNMNLFTGARINSPRSNLKNGFVSGKCIVN